MQTKGADFHKAAALWASQPQGHDTLTSGDLWKGGPAAVKLINSTLYLRKATEPGRELFIQYGTGSCQ